MKTLSIVVLMLLSVGVSSMSVAQTVVYKKTNPDGTISYSDQHSDGAVTMNESINNTAVMPSLQPPRERLYSSTTSTKSVNATDIYILKIVSPEDEGTVRSNIGEVDIVASLSPKASGSFQLMLNGELKSTQPRPVFHLNGLERGEYSLQVRFVGKSGKILALTQPQTFYLHKASVLINAN
jgi:hypothetical protein